MSTIVSDIFSDIRQRLAGIERDHNVGVLYACESGGRAWGFESRDSDDDVRFIYVRPRDWYLAIDATGVPAPCAAKVLELNARLVAWRHDDFDCHAAPSFTWTVNLIDSSQWFETHQRVSGRWITRLLNNGSRHCVTHSGTAYALLALAACGKTAPASPLDPYPGPPAKSWRA